MSAMAPTTARDLPLVTDRLGRRMHDLRISVTDRCNFRCTYCMPREVFGPGFQFLPRAELLTFEEITRLATRVRRGGGREAAPHRRRAAAADAISSS